jgi:hypothetical protein
VDLLGTLAHALFSGEARLWWLQEIKDIHDVCTWEQFRAAYLKRWGENEEQLFDALVSLKFAQGSRARDFCNRFKALCTAQELDDKVALKFFYKAIEHEGLRDCLKDKNPKSLDKAASMLIKMTLGKPSDGDHSTAKNTASRPTVTGATPTTHVFSPTAEDPGTLSQPQLVNQTHETIEQLRQQMEQMRIMYAVQNDHDIHAHLGTHMVQTIQATHCPPLPSDMLFPWHKKINK